MTKCIRLIAIIGSFCLLLYGLDYIDSSSGLETPQMEGGRTELELADINGDGHLDILSIGDHGSPYVNTNEHGIMVWFGDGQGNWNVYQHGDFGYGGIAIGDINNDGLLDVGYGMHHNYSNTDLGDSILEAALGDGTGQNWTAWDDGISIEDPDQWGMFCTDFADINNDGYLDLGANAFGADDGVHLFLNNGNGTWTKCFGFLGGNSTMDFLFGDINADGNADFVAAHSYGSIYLGDGIGNFSLADGNLPPAGTIGRRGPALGDVDNDGCLDFSFCNNDGGIEVWTWEGSNTWADITGTLPGTGPYEGTQLRDMNNDGYLDVVAFGDSTVTVWSGNGLGNWNEEITFNTPGPGDYAALRAQGDADHNGYCDIALVGEEGDSWNPINTPRFYKETSIPDSLFIFPVFPRGGETFITGSVHFIDWRCGVPTGDIATIDLELSTTGPGGPWSTIITGIPNNGRYQWTIPTGISSDDCYVRYTATTVTDTSVIATPSAFCISPLTAIKEQSIIHLGSDLVLSVLPTIMSNREISVAFNTTNDSESHVEVYDGCGKLVKKLFSVCGGGSFQIIWDGYDSDNQPLSNGTYFIVLQNANKSIVEKIIILH